MRTDSFLRFYYTVEPPRVYPIPSSVGDLSVALSQGTVLATAVAKRCGMALRYACQRVATARCNEPQRFQNTSWNMRFYWTKKQLGFLKTFSGMFSLQNTTTSGLSQSRGTVPLNKKKRREDLSKSFGLGAAQTGRRGACEKSESVSERIWGRIGGLVIKDVKHTLPE
jgi:hypothetical protein